MPIERLADATYANEILNHPAIYPWVAGGTGKAIDIQPVIDNPDNVVLGHKYGVAMFIKLLNGSYDMHIAVLPEARGQWVKQASLFCFRYMFARTDALELLTRCPLDNEAASRSALAAGMHYEFTTRPVWPSAKGGMVKMDVLTLGIGKWASMDDSLIEDGKWLHERYEQEFKRLGVTMPKHEPDENHDRYAGAAVAMIRAGQIAKGVGFYNRWALIAGYSPLIITRANPIEMEVDGVTMRLTNDNFEIVKCQQLQG